MAYHDCRTADEFAHYITYQRDKEQDTYVERCQNDPQSLWELNLRDALRCFGHFRSSNATTCPRRNILPMTFEALRSSNDLRRSIKDKLDEVYADGTTFLQSCIKAECLTCVALLLVQGASPNLLARKAIVPSFNSCAGRAIRDFIDFEMMPKLISSSACNKFGFSERFSSLQHDLDQWYDDPDNGFWNHFKSENVGCYSGIVLC